MNVSKVLKLRAGKMKKILPVVLQRVGRAPETFLQAEVAAIVDARDADSLRQTLFAMKSAAHMQGVEYNQRGYEFAWEDLVVIAADPEDRRYNWSLIIEYESESLPSVDAAAQAFSALVGFVPSAPDLITEAYSRFRTSKATLEM